MKELLDSRAAAAAARAREQARLRQARRRAKTSPRPNGPLRISITIQDPDLWRKACQAGERESLVAITESAIDDSCREYKRQASAAMWEKLSRTRTGLMDREAAGELDDSGEWGITDKVEPPPVMRRLKPSEMTEEQWEIYEAEYREAYEEWEARQNDAGNPETGEWRRVNTKHDWTRDS